MEITSLTLFVLTWQIGMHFCKKVKFIRLQLFRLHHCFHHCLYFVCQAVNPCKAARNLINQRRHQQVLSKSNFTTADEFNYYFIESVEQIVTNFPNSNNPNQEHDCNERVSSLGEAVTYMDIMNIVNYFKPSNRRDIFGMSI